MVGEEKDHVSNTEVFEMRSQRGHCCREKHRKEEALHPVPDRETEKSPIAYWNDD